MATTYVRAKCNYLPKTSVRIKAKFWTEILKSTFSLTTSVSIVTLTGLRSLTCVKNVLRSSAKRLSNSGRRSKKLQTNISFPPKSKGEPCCPACPKSALIYCSKLNCNSTLTTTESLTWRNSTRRARMKNTALTLKCRTDQCGKKLSRSWSSLFASRAFLTTCWLMQKMIKLTSRRRTIATKTRWTTG